MAALLAAVEHRGANTQRHGWPAVTGAFFQVVLTEPRLGKLLPGQLPPHPAGPGPTEHGRAARCPWRPTGCPVRPYHGTITGHLAVPSPGAIDRPLASGDQGPLPPACSSNADAARFSNDRHIRAS